MRDLLAVAQVEGLPEELADFGVQEVYAFLAAVRSRGVSSAYQHRRHRELRAFFAWCKRMGFAADNPFARVPMIKLEEKLVEPFTLPEVRRLLAAIDTDGDTGRRNQALLLFLLDSGVRSAECMSVALADVDWRRGRVRILNGKGRKQRWVAIGDRTTSALRRYVETDRGRWSGPLFASSRGPWGMRTGALATILRRIAERAGVEGVHPHRFRHTFATWAIRGQAREVDVQSLLGHSTLAMVQRYSRTYSSEEAVLAHHRFSPVAMLDEPG